METWLKTSLLLCVFGFFRELRPSEPFVTEFLAGEWRNLTTEQINQEVYPMGTYSYLAQLFIVFLITDMLRYKIIIVISALVGVIIWTLLLWTSTLGALKVVQVFYGTYMAAEVAYYTYIYAKVDRDRYQVVTGHTRSSILAGRFLAGILAQILYSYELMDVRELNYISFGSQCISVIWAILLPSAAVSLYFYTTKEAEPNVQIDMLSSMPAEEDREKVIQSLDNNRKTSDDSRKTINVNANDGDKQVEHNNEPNSPRQSLVVATNVKFSFDHAIKLLYRHFIDAFTNRTVVLWSVWWALAMSGFISVQYYVQFLWHQINVNDDTLYNGATEAALTLFGALSAFLAGLLNSKVFEKWGIWITSGIALIEGGLTLWSAYTDNIWIAYVCYVVFGTLYHFMITMSSAIIAKQLIEDSFALIFGLNTLLALILQTIMTLIFVADTGLALSPRQQFEVYGFYFIALAGVYGLTGVITLIISRCRRS